MSISKQGILGATMLVGGGVMLFALIQQPDSTDANTQTTQMEEITLTAINPDEQALAMDPDEQALTTDIETEAKILEKKQKQREALVKAQEQKSKAFIAEQERAAVQAMEKTRKENEKFRQAQAKIQAEKAKQEEIARPKVASRQPDNSNQQANNVSVAKKQNVTPKASHTNNKYPPKQPITHFAKNGEGLISLSKKYNVPLEILAEANDMHILDNLMYGQKLIIPSQAQIAKLERNVKQKQAMRQAKIKAEAEANRKAKEQAKLKAQREREAKKKRLEAERKKRKEEQQKAIKAKEAKRNAQQKLIEARRTAKKENAKGTFGVQVALAGDQENADKIAQKFRKAGYKAKTSRTSRGVRVIVGPERGKVAALALKDKINSDPKVNTTGAWVLYWR